MHGFSLFLRCASPASCQLMKGEVEGKELETTDSLSFPDLSHRCKVCAWTADRLPRARTPSVCRLPAARQRLRAGEDAPSAARRGVRLPKARVPPRPAPTRLSSAAPARELPRPPRPGRVSPPPRATRREERPAGSAAPAPGRQAQAAALGRRARAARRKPEGWPGTRTHRRAHAEEGTEVLVRQPPALGAVALANCHRRRRSLVGFPASCGGAAATPARMRGAAGVPGSGGSAATGGLSSAPGGGAWRCWAGPGGRFGARASSARPIANGTSPALIERDCRTGKSP